MSIAFIYYSHNQLPDRLRDVCLSGINHAACLLDVERIMVVADRIHTDAADKWYQIEMSRISGVAADITQRVLAGCECTSADYVALIEHDVLYPSDYLSLTPWYEVEIGGFWYDLNSFRVNAHGFFFHGGKLMSCCVARRELMVEHFRMRRDCLLGGIRFKWQEPGKDIPSETVKGYYGQTAVLDVRWGGNATGMREAPEYLQSLHGWLPHAELWEHLTGG